MRLSASRLLITDIDPFRPELFYLLDYINRKFSDRRSEKNKNKNCHDERYNYAHCLFAGWQYFKLAIFNELLVTYVAYANL